MGESGANKPAMKRIGYFGEEGYIGIGDMYNTKNADGGDRYKGAQFTTNPRFKQKFNLQNGLFARAEPLYNGEPYITLEQFQRREKNKNKARNVSEVPFRPANPPKQAMGNFGSNYGTVGYSDKTTPAFPVGGRIPYISQGGRAAKKKDEIQSEPYNVVTNPIRKGTFGYTSTTIGVPTAAGSRRAWKGVAGEYAYLPDPYDAALQAEREFRKKQPKNVSDNPFRPANPSKKGGPGMWGSNKNIPNGGCISKYHEYLPTGNERKKTKKDVEEEKYKDKYDRMAFRPSNPAKKGGPGYWGCGDKAGGSGTLTSFPKAMADPYGTLRQKLLDEKKATKEGLGALGDRPAFNPGSFGRSKRTPSIFTMNIRV
mmetsp:Transcript_34446/g.71072  ORF Transcript_34446/g.71072 Transcript_34446/m.71072 type:complete len:369 (+) Transcript_34446:169-1275(+)|eukprot:CAMPEP_0181301120 /NCGR_PEP_ID=MMETSP1101-20121128/7253_1 /TAXON_ID=46948 /ORGANISM="Rhodomonas abbreviata, Strain Caron Lab Isolate" /LENGTH=368 /DNA_ID=CAMNT_0023406401 /DNA_START=168 /DNA_END=1274 /DNA_ORIENTATION=+